jgi:excisionase family DNA binding protein
MVKQLAYSADEASVLLSISKAHVHRLINTRAIRAVKLGRRIVIPAAELEKLLAEQTSTTVNTTKGDGEDK